MEIFIDKAFLIHLFNKHSQFPTDLVVSDVVVFLSRLSNVRVYTNIDAEELRSNAIFRKLTNAGETIPRYIPQLHEQLHSPHVLGSSSYKVFFVEHEQAQQIASSTGHLLFTSNNLSTLWPTFSSQREDLEIPIAPEYACDLLQWNFLKNCTHPTRSILITDRYMFKSLDRVNDNLIPLLKRLIKKPYPQTEVLLIGLFSDKEQAFPIHQIYLLIKSTFAASDNIRLHLLDAKLGVHSRGVVTSYWYINPDTSFDFINNNAISNRSDGNIYHGFLFRPSKIRLVKQLLKKIKEKLEGHFVAMYDSKTEKPVTVKLQTQQFAALQY